eukprot:gene14877-29085_t
MSDLKARVWMAQSGMQAALFAARKALPLQGTGLDKVRCPTGASVVTSGRFGSLAVDHVIHTVGPAFHGDPYPNGDEGVEGVAPFAAKDVLLQSAYTTSLAIAEQVGAKTVGFSLISAGIFAGQ